jgi:hypothetical protein
LQALSFYLSPLPALLFLVAGLALRCHVSPSSQTKNLPAMKGTSEGGERESQRGWGRRRRRSGWSSMRRHGRMEMEQENMYVWQTPHCLKKLYPLFLHMYSYIGIIISYVGPSVSACAGHLYHLYRFCKPKGTTLPPHIASFWDLPPSLRLSCPSG